MKKEIIKLNGKRYAVDVVNRILPLTRVSKTSIDRFSTEKGYYLYGSFTFVQPFGAQPDIQKKINVFGLLDYEKENIISKWANVSSNVPVVDALTLRVDQQVVSFNVPMLVRQIDADFDDLGVVFDGMVLRELSD